MRRHILTRGPVSRISAPALLAALALGGAALVSGLAGAPDPARAQVWTGTSSNDDINYRLSVIDAELADIRARVGATGGTRSGGSGGGGTDTMLRLDRLEAELRSLTGRLEKMQFEQKSISDDAARRFNDIEFRLTTLEGGDVSSLQPVTSLGTSATPPAKQAGPEVSISERDDLDRAITDVKQGRFDMGEDRLRTFLTSYPGSPLTGEALYWMGESQFIRGAFQNAARSYLDGYNSNRRSETAPKNLERLGTTLGKLGQTNEACLTLREVRNQFPSGPADVLDRAEAEARRLRCG